MSFAFAPIYTGDYFRDTRGLSPLQHGVYLLLLLYCWDTKGAVPLLEQEQVNITGCRTPEEVEALRYILNRYFIQQEDGYYSARMQREIERAEAVSRKRSSAGRKGFQAKARQLPNTRQAIATTPTPTPTPTPRTTTPTPQPPSGGRVRVEVQHLNTDAEPDGDPHMARVERGTTAFEAFWSAYPRKVGKAAALRTWNRARLGPHLQTIIAAIRDQQCTDQWQRGFIPNPQTWLNQRRWEDVVTTLAHPDQRCSAISLETGVRCPRPGVTSNGRRWFCREHDV